MAMGHLSSLLLHLTSCSSRMLPIMAPWLPLERCYWKSIRNLELYDSAQAGTVATPFDVSNAMLPDDAMDDLQSRLQPAA
jgi:hypothetical protein